MQRIQRLLHHICRYLQLRQTVQIFLRQITVLIHQLRHIFAQGQHGLWQPLTLQLVAEERAEALQRPVHGSRLRRPILLMGKGAAERPGVQPACPLPQALIGGAEVGGIGQLQRWIFLRQPPQIVQKLLRVHLQDLHGLQKLGRQLQLLP